MIIVELLLFVALLVLPYYLGKIVLHVADGNLGKMPEYVAGLLFILCIFLFVMTFIIFRIAMQQCCFGG